MVKNHCRPMRDQLAEGAQVGVREILQRAELVLEAQDGFGGEGAQRLERDAHAPLAVVGLVDHPHAAFAEPAQHVETPVGAKVELDGRHDVPL